MTPEQATADIIYLIYEAAIISPDPVVQETHVETSIRDILEELLNSSEPKEDVEIDLRDANIEIEVLKNRIAELESSTSD